MITIEHSQFWEESLLDEESSYLIDLKGQLDKSSILNLFCETFKTQSSFQGPYLNPNFDGVNDILSDWFIEHWGYKKNIYIVGCANLIEKEPTLAMILMNVINSAFLGAIYNQSLNHCSNGICDEINMLSIMFVKT